MPTGSRAFCILMALAATGTEVASASAATARVEPGHYRVESKILNVSGASLRQMGGADLTGRLSDKMIGLLERNADAGSVTFPSVEAGDSLPVSIVTGNLNPQGPAQQRYAVLTLVPGKGSTSGFSLRFSIIRPAGLQDQAAQGPAAQGPAFDTLRTKVGADSAGEYWCFSVPSADADGRRRASVADANERQLLFVKITRG